MAFAPLSTRSVRRDLLLLAGDAAIAYALAFRLAGAIFGLVRFLLPLLLAAPAVWMLWRYLAADRRPDALKVMFGWAFALVVLGTIAMTIAPEAAEAAVLRGESYRVEMMTWLATGEGAEEDPGPFLPLHLQRLALFLPLSLLSGGALGLVMGAVMVNSMDFFVASYALASSGVPAALAWFPWALCRVAAFVILVVLTAEPLVRRVRRPESPPAPGRVRLLWTAAGLLLADRALKTVLAPFWGRTPATYLDGPAAGPVRLPAPQSGGWWAMQDLNLRLLPCEGSTLPLS